MIQCPSCGKDIADDSAHCGFCGAEIETGSGKKTMIGFAAVSGDVLRQAAEEARRAREQASADPSPPPAEEPGAPSIGKLKIPPPAGSAPDDEAKTNILPSVGSAASTVSESAIAAEANDTDPMSFGGDVDATDVSPPPVAEPTLPEVETPSVVPRADSAQPSVNEGPTEFGGPVEVPHTTLPEKKRNPALILVAVVGVIAFFCCAATLAWSIFPMVVGAM